MGEKQYTTRTSIGRGKYEMCGYFVPPDSGFFRGKPGKASYA
jgi:hypothetical protein